MSDNRYLDGLLSIVFKNYTLNDFKAYCENSNNLGGGYALGNMDRY